MGNGANSLAESLPARLETPDTADIEFGPFLLTGHGGSLYRHGEPVRLGSRARHILLVLLASAGEVVSKRAIIEAVWPDTTVVDNNLTVHIAALRQALDDGRNGEHYIVNVPGRGYRFVASVRPILERRVNIAASPTARSSTNLPARLSPAIGLAGPMGDVRDKLLSNNLVTITGPAGVGKTTLALHVAQSHIPSRTDGVWLIDLAALGEAELLPNAVATTLHIEAGSADPTNSLLLALTQSRALLVLDNCEHMLDAVADLAAKLLKRCPDIVLLTTSREPLRIIGEATYILAPLEAPPDNAAISATEALSYPAVQLFIERVTSATNTFSLSEEDALSAARICSRLDGLPLALEFASALVGAFSLADVAARLDDLFKLIQSNMRGAPLRHRTLTAALDWSYRLLTDEEQMALRRLAVFAGGFTLEGAAALTGILDLGEAGALLAKLHAKSLITRDVACKDLRFRLLETTRAYAWEKLKAGQEAVEVARRHALYFSDFLRQQRLQLGVRDVAEDAAELDNIRSALRFALGSEGSLDLALSLTSGALPIWLGLSLISECRARLRDVLSRLSPEQAASSEGWDLEITLRITEMVTSGTSQEAFDAWAHATGLAPSAPHTRRPDLGDVLTRWVWSLRRGHARETAALADQYSTLVKGRQDGHLESSRAWTQALTAFQLGRLSEAKKTLGDFLRLESPQSRKIFVGRTGIDRTPGVYGALGATLCLLGETQEGIRVARLAEETGRATTKALPLCDGKIWTHVAFEIALIEPSALQSGVEDLLVTARNQGLVSYHGFGLGLQGLLAFRQGRYPEAETLLQEAVETLRITGLEWGSAWFHGQLGLCMGLQGRVEEGLQVLKAWDNRDRNPNGWSAAEFRRLLGALHRLNGDLEQSHRELSHALAIASAQGAVAWHLRASDDLEQIRQAGRSALPTDHRSG
jgi:predicted ATPase/DNA-binding winged helix-turn-helix (wHTH) protein